LILAGRGPIFLRIVAHAHHHHGHTHSGPAEGSLSTAFVLGAVLNTAFIAVEVAYGIFANSVSLLADAGHNLGDVLGLFVAWGGLLLARRRPSARFTYGLRSSSILAALFNAVTLLITVGIIAVESIRRLYAPEPVAGLIVMIVAAIGMVINGGTALLFSRGRKIDINMRGVFLHMLGDAVVSLGVVIGGALVLATGQLWLDPLVGLLVAVFLVISTWRLLTQSVAMALHAVPADIDPDQVMGFMEKLNGVAQVHDLHIWPMSTTERALTCHLIMPGGHPGDKALADLSHELEHRFRIGHVTIQVETGDPSAYCKLVPDHIV
jgi:cobalt-zinc-cadmium efflux system protein